MAVAIAKRSGRRIGLDTVTRMVADADMTATQDVAEGPGPRRLRKGSTPWMSFRRRLHAANVGTGEPSPSRRISLPALNHPQSISYRRRQVRRLRVNEVREVSLASSVWVPLFVPQAGRRDRLQDVDQVRLCAESLREHREAVPPDPRAIAAGEAHDHVGMVAEAEGPMAASVPRAYLYSRWRRLPASPRNGRCPCPRQRSSWDDCWAFTLSRSRPACSRTGARPWRRSTNGSQRAVDAVLGYGRYRRWPRGRLGHNVWSGGALPVVVTLMGWAALLKGVALLLVPSDRMADAYKGIGLSGSSMSGWSAC